MNPVLKVILIVVAVIIALLVVLYIIGRKMQERQAESQKLIESSSQQFPILVIDKKKMKLKEAPLPKEVFEKAPKYSKLMKVCVVKAKIGPRVINLICEDRVFRHLPDKETCTVKLSGIYITDIVKGAKYSEKEIAKRQKAKEKAARKAGRA